MDEPVTVLLVEDDKLDVKTVRRAFKANHLTNPLVVVKHGEQALAFLRKEGDYANARTPGLILLDLNMPVMNGIEFLREFRSDPKISATPVMVLTTSSHDRDTVAAYRFGIGGYFMKPTVFTEFVEVVRTIDEYWGLCELPPPGSRTGA